MLVVDGQEVSATANTSGAVDATFSAINSLVGVDMKLQLYSPYGKNVSKCFFSETTWTVETKLPRNDHCKVLYKVSVLYADRKSKMAATTGHSINTGPYGQNTEIYSSLKLLH